MIAYDLETTRIAAGTPEPLYITAFSDERNFVLSKALPAGLQSLKEILLRDFLVPEFNRVKFVAWNGNNFDVYFVAMALLDCDDFIIRPYLTAGKSLRGLRVIHKEDLELKPNAQRNWEFLDGIAMLGLQGKTLKDFLKTFAPEYQKHERDSFEAREFDPNDPEDVSYAFRDSEGLYFGMGLAQQIIFECFRFGLRATIGNLGIRIFESRIPEGKRIIRPNDEIVSIVRAFVCRGGFCHLMRKYKGPVWKYDLNQAYAAAMRETKLPAGDCFPMKTRRPKISPCYISRITATNPKNKIPFYCRMMVDGKVKTAFALTEITDSWLCSSEIQQLESEGWRITFHDSFAWNDSFDMKEYVDALETLRGSAEGGPSGAAGTVIKAIGNNSYGKTLEVLDNVELVMARECPPEFNDHLSDDGDPIPYVWERETETADSIKNYHQPHVGAFITAYVRMVVRRAALLNPSHFLYADTDCVMFSCDMTSQFDIDPRRYGAFKLEESGSEFSLIAKKVYASTDFKTRHAKGLRIRELTFSDFARWYEGTVPIQTQHQRQNFVKHLAGVPMFVTRTRKGTRV